MSAERHDPASRLVATAREAPLQPMYLVHGDLVLAEPAAMRLATALAERLGCAVETHRRPARLAPLLADLRTFSLFATAKVMLVVDTAALADATVAAELVKQAIEGLPAGEGELGGREREAASRLLQALRLFGIPPEAPDAVDRLPDWALEKSGKGGGRGRASAKGKGENVRDGLAALLRRGIDAELVGWAEGEQAELAAIADGGLPDRNVLILAESAVSADHPLVVGLAARGAAAGVGRVEADRRGWLGLEPIVAELERETGAGIAPEALRELARRTLRREDEGRGGGGATDTESTGRFAAEYRKLAAMSGGGRIERELVDGGVEDRGEEDLWGLLDAVAAGEARDAAERLRRFLQGATDPSSARLAFFATLAGFCRQLTAIGGMLTVAGVPAGERSYDRFKEGLAARLQGALPSGGRNPLTGIHPFRLHRAYLAASRLAPDLLLSLPWRVLETELALKGEGGDADAALAGLVGVLAEAPATGARRR